MISSNKGKIGDDNFEKRYIKGGSEKFYTTTILTNGDLRHYHATSLLKAGIHPKIVSERLGHSNISITLDTYSHVIPDMQKEAAKISSEILLKNHPEKPSENPDVCKNVCTDDEKC